MFLENLLDHVVYDLCKYLSFMDIINLSKTCKKFYVLIEKDDYFWMMLIKNHFGLKLYQRYVHEIFHNKKNSDYVLYRTDKDIEKFEKSYQRKKGFFMCTTWLLNMLNGNENSDGYLAYKSMIQRKKHSRTNNDELKMSLTIDEFFQYYFQRKKYFNQENILQLSLYKLIYFYLIDSKRLLAVNLFGIYLRCSFNHLYCTNKLYLNQENNLDCLTGRCVRLYCDRYHFLLGIKGKFKSILPGIYQITCRIKLDKNEEYLTYFNKRCSEEPHLETNVSCYFYAFAHYGLDCECTRQTMNYDWFESNYLLYENKIWFNQIMGKIKVFEVSDIDFGFKSIGGCRYLNVLFDYIELSIVQ